MVLHVVADQLFLVSAADRPSSPFSFWIVDVLNGACPCQMYCLFSVVASVGCHGFGGHLGDGVAGEGAVLVAPCGQGGVQVVLGERVLPVVGGLSHAFPDPVGVAGHLLLADVAFARVDGQCHHAEVPVVVGHSLPHEPPHPPVVQVALHMPAVRLLPVDDAPPVPVRPLLLSFLERCGDPVEQGRQVAPLVDVHADHQLGNRPSGAGMPSSNREPTAELAGAADHAEALVDPLHLLVLQAAGVVVPYHVDQGELELLEALRVRRRQGDRLLEEIVEVQAGAGADDIGRRLPADIRFPARLRIVAQQGRHVGLVEVDRERVEGTGDRVRGADLAASRGADRKLKSG